MRVTTQVEHEHVQYLPEQLNLEGIIPSEQVPCAKYLISLIITKSAYQKSRQRRKGIPLQSSP